MNYSVVFAVALMTVGACNAASPRTDSAVSVRVDSSRQDTVAQSTDDCVRGEPEPVLEAAGTAPPPRFDRTGKLSAIEELQLDDTTSLRLTHSGCAHYTEAYTFTIRGATRDTTESDYWLERGAALLRSLPARETRVSQLGELAKALTVEAAKPGPFSYSEPISIPELSTLTISVTRSSDGAVVEIVYDVAL